MFVPFLFSILVIVVKLVLVQYISVLVYACWESDLQLASEHSFWIHYALLSSWGTRVMAGRSWVPSIPRWASPGLLGSIHVSSCTVYVVYAGEGSTDLLVLTTLCLLDTTLSALLSYATDCCTLATCLSMSSRFSWTDHFHNHIRTDTSILIQAFTIIY